MFSKTHLAKVAEAKNRWQQKLRGQGRIFPERKDSFRNFAEIPIKELYTPLDLDEFNYDKLGFPGEAPFTRGLYPAMYRSRLWTIRQAMGTATAEETNRLFRFLLKQGQTGLSVGFDLPTQMGLDSDHPLARGEVGKVGVAVDSLADMEELFADIPLDKVSTAMTINASAGVLLAMYIAAAEKQGVSAEQLRGTVQNDILKEYVARGAYIFPPRPSLRLIMDLFAYCADKLPRWKAISVSGYHMREAGSTSVQEMAFALSNAVAYIEAAIDYGLDIDDFAPQLSFFFSAHLNIFEEVAKFRAARRIWARLIEERFGARKQESMMLRFHAQTAGSALTAQNPDVNIVRVAYQALAAVLGGTQSLHTNPFDEAQAFPTEQSALLALRTQQVIAHELDVADTVDPLGGGYFIESLTDQMEQKIIEQMEEIDRLGGSIRAVENKFMRQKIEESAYRYQKECEKGERTVIGMNKHVQKGVEISPHSQSDPEVVSCQIDRLNNNRQNRNPRRVTEILMRLRRMARTEENLMPVILEAVKEYATVGEICGVLREVFGEEHHEGYRLPGEQQEDISCDRKKPLRVLLAKIGLDGHDRGAKVIARALQDAGMEVIYTGLHQHPEQVVQTAVEEGVHLVGVSILSGAHMQLLPPLVELFRQEGAADIPVLAGGTISRDDISYLREKGVAGVFTTGTTTKEIVDYINRLMEGA